MISAKIITDSLNTAITLPNGKHPRITTMELIFPRFILAELNTHRMFSKNSASSRAISFKKMVQSVMENPFIPIAWQKDHKGMQGTEYMNENQSALATSYWLDARDEAVRIAKELNSGEVTKQLCNRLLEPFMWHKVLLTATEWENFFYLRCPKYTMLYTHNGEERGKEVYRSKKDLMKAENVSDVGVDWFKMNTGQAEIHMMALAEAMWDAYNESTPNKLKEGEWHIPFSDDLDEDGLKATYGEEIAYEMMIKIATACCARTSYTVVGEEGKVSNYENDIKLHDSLLISGHMSPFEHVAQAMNEDDTYDAIPYPIERCKYPDGWSGNFCGFIQYRKTLPNENRTS